MKQLMKRRKTHKASNTDKHAHLFALVEALYWDVEEALRQNPNFRVEIEEFLEKAKKYDSAPPERQDLPPTQHGD